ncbi:aminoglycoside N(3)-acetyltransferase [Peterkaempfera bronchialis]|uniref:Aminoglycoside N(3)-acetyltransferase n=1 Tax=Peterkaempfera bronchialis TaxID=2126346 RepID=A0A345T1S8_9ACTN|nr:aminoglycoside N(3)-acetyltransferase [Peterkaempfera bronchialis]
MTEPPSGPLCTRHSLAADLRTLGVLPGETVLVHSSLSSLGWVCGGAVAVLEALLDVVGAAGTLVVPTHTGGNSDPAQWRNPPVPEEWWQPIRDTMPAYDPRTSPTLGMGDTAARCRPRRADRAPRDTERSAPSPAADPPSTAGRQDPRLHRPVLGPHRPPTTAPGGPGGHPGVAGASGSIDSTAWKQNPRSGWPVW